MLLMVSVYITWFCAQALLIIHDIADTHKAAGKVEQQPHLSLDSQTLGHARDGQISKVEKKFEEELIQAKCE